MGRERQSARFATVPRPCCGLTSCGGGSRWPPLLSSLVHGWGAICCSLFSLVLVGVGGVAWGAGGGGCLGGGAGRGTGSACGLECWWPRLWWRPLLRRRQRVHRTRGGRVCRAGAGVWWRAPRGSSSTSRWSAGPGRGCVPSLTACSDATCFLSTGGRFLVCFLPPSHVPAAPMYFAASVVWCGVLMCVVLPPLHFV